MSAMDSCEARGPNTTYSLDTVLIHLICCIRLCILFVVSHQVEELRRCNRNTMLLYPFTVP